MNKFGKKAVALTCAVAMSVGIGASMTACAETGGTIKIGVGVYETTGAAAIALTNYLDALEPELGVEFVQKALSQTDEATNLSAAQELISSGCQGLILTMDSATEAILDECEEAGVYVAGYLNSYDVTYDTVKTHPNFLGTACDGKNDGSAWGASVAERMIADGYRNIGIVKFPSFAFPKQAWMDTAFRDVVAEWNEENPDDQVALKETVELNFSPLDATYLTQNSDIDAIFSICAGTDFIYPTLVANNKTNIKLYTAGMSVNDDILNNFGDRGNQCIQEMVYCSVESVLYPIVLLMNKISDNVFADQPDVAERLDCGQVIVQTSADVDLIKTNSIYYTGDASKAMIKPSEAKELLAANGGTYAELKAAMEGLTIEALRENA